MQKIIFILSLLLFFNTAPVNATETNIDSGQNDIDISESNDVESSENINPEATVHIGYDKIGEVKKLSLTKDEDDLYADTNVVPLSKGISDEEIDTKDISLFDDNTDQPLMALNCDNPKLKQQIINFIFQKINMDETHSVVEKRLRALLVKNMQNFKEIKNDEIAGKSAFNARAAVMELRVNKHFPTQKICESKGNDFDKFESIYAIIYEDEGYYKVIVTNLMTSPSKTDSATFVFNWQ